MKISSSYPYPVLQEGNDDYIQSSYLVDYDVVTQFGELKVDVTFQLKNEGITFQAIHRFEVVWCIYSDIYVTIFFWHILTYINTCVTI